MAKQLEDRYTKIVNEILDKFINTSLSGQELRIILFVIRKTWGFNKTEDYISLSKMEEATGISKIRCSQIVNSLQLMKILTVTENINGLTKKYKFNKYFENWQTVNKNINRLEKVKPLIKTLTTKENNKGISYINNKKNIYSRDAQKVLDYLNNKKGSKYTTKDAIIARLKDKHTVDECIKVIDTKFCDPYFKSNKHLLRPSTLFRKSNFDNYINESPDDYEKEQRDAYDILLEQCEKE